jgi:TonB family protein
MPARPSVFQNNASQRQVMTRGSSCSAAGQRESGQIPQILPSLFADHYSHQVRPANFYLSFLLHGAGIAALLLLKHAIATSPDIRLPPRGLVETPIHFSLLQPWLGTAGGCGSSPDRAPASSGPLPKASDIQFTPPEVLIRNQDPALPIPPTIVAPPLPLSQNDTLGDLSSVLTVPSSGVRPGTGIGNSQSGSGGIGDRGGRFPSFGPGAGGPGGISTPRLVYKVDPEFTDEARHAHYQGVVIVEAEIGADGLVHHARAAHPVGMGLDQKALDAVQQWHFEPARINGKPVATQVSIEVSFRLF